MLNVVCAWCGMHLKGSEAAVEVSHGICQECQTKTEADYPLHLLERGKTRCKPLKKLPPSDGPTQRPI